MLQEEAIHGCSSNLLNSNIRQFAVRFQGPNCLILSNSEMLTLFVSLSLK